MRAIASILAALGVAGCGGGADREAFVRDANQACRDHRRERAALPDTASLADGLKLFERHVARLKELEPPDADRARFREVVRFQEAGVDAWREFTQYAAKDQFDAGEPARQRSDLNFVRAAQVAGRLGLSDCDRALS